MSADSEEDPPGNAKGQAGDLTHCEDTNEKLWATVTVAIYYVKWQRQLERELKAVEESDGDVLDLVQRNLVEMATEQLDLAEKIRRILGQ